MKTWGGTRPPLKNVLLKLKFVDSPVEGECLGVAWSLKKAKYFVLGCENLVVAVDHKPLLGILNDRYLDDIDNPRLQDLKEHTLKTPAVLPRHIH